MSASTPSAADERRTMRRVGFSVVTGTTIEWYDFQIYGAAAAIVLPQLFFPGADPVAGTLLAFSTFAVGFAARPLGGVIIGHFGDRLGRKKMLVVSLTLMGVATFVIGLLPTYDQIGVAAPLLLVLLRLIQGIGIGGEWGGAVLTAVEYAKPEQRGFYGSLPQVGVPAGLFLATLAFLGVSQLPEEQFLSWGWRVPFLISIVLVVIGLYVRFKLDETPSFAKVKERREEARLPLVEAFRGYPRLIALATGSMISTGAYFYIVNTYAISYATETESLTRTEMLTGVLVAAVVTAIALPYFGAVAQRFGRRRMIMTGLLAMLIWIFPTMAAIDSGSLPLVLAAYTVGALLFSISYGPQATFIAELFDARVRFTAASTSFQMGVLLGGALAPIVATSLVAATGSGFAVAGYVAVLSLVSFLSVLAVTTLDVERGSRDMGGLPDDAPEVAR